MKKQYTIPIFDLKKDIDAKIMQLKNDVDSVQQNSSTIEKSDSGVTIRRLEAIETALTGYDKHLSTFRSGLTDEIGAEVARQNIVIDSQKNLIAKIEDRVTTLGSHMVNVEAAISGQEPAEKKDEAIKFLNDKVNRIVAGLNREKAKRDEKRGDESDILFPFNFFEMPPNPLFDLLKHQAELSHYLIPYHESFLHQTFYLTLFQKIFLIL